MFFSPFSIAITSLGEERANLSAFRTFVRFVLVWICRFPLPLGVWEGLRFVIVALPGLFSYLFFYKEPTIIVKGQRLQVVDKFTYLGSKLSRVVHIDDEFNARIAKTSAAFGRLRVSVWDGSGIRLFGALQKTY